MTMSKMTSSITERDHNSTEPIAMGVKMKRKRRNSLIITWTIPDSRGDLLYSFFELKPIWPEVFRKPRLVGGELHTFG
jgi:hypothetical protein